MGDANLGGQDTGMVRCVYCGRRVGRKTHMQDKSKCPGRDSHLWFDARSIARFKEGRIQDIPKMRAMMMEQYRAEIEALDAE